MVVACFDQILLLEFFLVRAERGSIYSLEESSEGVPKWWYGTEGLAERTGGVGVLGACRA